MRLDPTRLARAAAAFALLVLAPGGRARAEAPPPERLVPEVAHGGFLATAGGPAVALTLPAALALADADRALLGLELDGDRRYAGAVFLWEPRRFALGYRHLDAGAYPFNEDHYLVAIAKQEGTRFFGLDLNWLRNDLGGTPDALSLGFSTAVRPHDSASVAFRIQHANRPHYAGGRLERVTALGIGLQPFGRRLWLAADLLFRADGADDMLLRAGFETTPLDRLHLVAAADNERGFRFALALAAAEHELGYGLAGDRDGGPRRHLLHLGREEGATRRQPPAPPRRPGPRPPGR